MSKKYKRSGMYKSLMTKQKFNIYLYFINLHICDWYLGLISPIYMNSYISKFIKSIVIKLKIVIGIRVTTKSKRDNAEGRIFIF